MAIQITQRPHEYAFSGNPIQYTLYSAEAAGDPTIFFEIRVMFRPITAATFSEITTLPWAPAAGWAKVNIQDLLHAQLTWEVPPFEADEKTIHPATGQSGVYYLEFREITQADPAPAWNTSENGFERVVVKGGINYFQWRGNNYWVNYHAPKMPFLTWQSGGRMAGPQERMFLLWFNTLDTATASVEQRITVHYTDGTTATLSNWIMEAKRHWMYYLPTGAAQLGLTALQPAKSILHWEVQMIRGVVGDPPVSEVFRYTLDNKNDYNGVVIHYRNSLGGLDSVRIRGVVETNVDYNYTEQNRTYEPDYWAGPVVTPQRVITDSVEGVVYRGDVGYLSKAEQERLRDLHIIREAYQEKRGKWWPVLLLTKSLKLTQTGAQLFALPIEWCLAYDGGHYYTPEAVELGDAVAQANVCIATITGINITTTFGDPATPGEVMVSVLGSESDPQNAAAQFRWRCLPHHDWQTLHMWQLAFTFYLPENDGVRTLEVQAICEGNIYGTITTAQVDTVPVP